MIAPWYAMTYTRLSEIVKEHGYALTLHGSMARDLDLVAIPWTDEPSEVGVLLQAVVDFICDKADGIAYPTPLPTEKPHGRMSYIFPVGLEGHYFDFSVMPKKEG